MPTASVYLAGPMRGIPDYNYPAFNRAADGLRTLGLRVFNPAEADVYETHGIHGAMRCDLNWILDNADAVYVLPGWQRSHGAQTEIALGLALGLPVYEIASVARLEKHGVLTLQRIHSVMHPHYAPVVGRG